MSADITEGGNPFCWHDVFTFDLCCAARHGPGGNTECWDEIFTSETCCSSPSSGWTDEQIERQVDGRQPTTSCWEDARYFLSTSGDPISEHPALYDESNLQKFCCYPTAFSSQVCWGGGRDDGSVMFRDSMSGEDLNFTAHYAACCLPQLRELTAAEQPPEWVARSLDRDFAAWTQRGPFEVEDLAEAEVADAAAAAAELESDVPPKAAGILKLCRFRIRGSQVLHCDFAKMRYNNLMHAVRNALHIFQAISPLPDLDFLVYATGC